MAFLKQANAVVVHPRVSGKAWSQIRQAAVKAPTKDLTLQAKNILGEALDPSKYLFTHCTIVASVDVEQAPGVKLGKILQGAKTLDRRYADFLIQPQCSQYVNSNGDSWAREVLEKSFPTFVGGHNFQEHDQREEKSKGRILDAVSRDVGDSLYIDILVATNRKHTKLVEDILSETMSTLSMGCTTDFTICSKCGNVAADETELCDCIRYEKLNTFIDDQGVKRVIAELCGHQMAGPTGGVYFKEASWVKTPAFKGAVLRNIYSIGSASDLSLDARRVLASPAPNTTRWSEAAMLKVAGAEGVEAEPAAEPAQPPADTKQPFQDLEDSIYKSVSDRVKQRLQKDLAGPESAPLATDWTNNSIVKEGSTAKASKEKEAFADLYRSSILAVTKAASSEAALINAVAEINSAFHVDVDQEIYRLALNIGPIADPSVYVSACEKRAGRVLTTKDLRTLVKLSSLLTKWAAQNSSSNSRRVNPCQ